MTDEREGAPNALSVAGASRRRALVQSATGIAALACALGGCATSTKVQGNMTKDQAQYQDHPSGLERCGVCRHFIPLTGCEIVAAPVQSNGWCQSYAFL